MNRLLSLFFATELIFFGDFTIAEGSPRFVPIDADRAVAVSADGQTVAGYDGPPFLWREATGLQRIPLPSGLNLFSVFDISGDGTTIVGGVSMSSGLGRYYESFRWRADTNYQLLGRLPESEDWAFATGVSYNGSVVVGTSDTAQNRRAFRWTQATGIVSLGTLGTAHPSSPPFSEAGGVSADGKTIVGYVTTTTDGYYKAFRWTESIGYDVLGLPPDEQSRGIPAGGADAISGDGTVIAGISQLDGFDNWTWSQDTGFSLLNMETLQNSGRIHNISFDGSVIVGRQITWNQPVSGQAIDDAVFWQRTPSGYEIHRVADVLSTVGVSTAGWHLEETTDVSDDGRTIVGVGTDPSGRKRSWFAVLPMYVPEPTGLFLAAVALAYCLIGVRSSK